MHIFVGHAMGRRIMTPEYFLSHHYILISPFWCKQELSHPMEFQWTMRINLCTHLSNKVRCLIAKLIDRQSPLFSAQCLSLYVRIFVRRFFFLSFSRSNWIFLLIGFRFLAIYPFSSLTGSFATLLYILMCTSSNIFFLVRKLMMLSVEY